MEITREGFLELLALPFDGILGLGFQDIAIGQATPVWYVFDVDNFKVLLNNSPHFSSIYNLSMLLFLLIW